MTSRGLSIVELLVTLAVTAVLFGFAVPSFTSYVNTQRAVAAINQMIGAVQMARHAAIVHRAHVTLCPGTGEVCGRRNEWHVGALIFKDANNNGERDRGETIVTRLPRLRDGERVYWRSFRNKAYLQFRASGLTDWQNGHFLYCPPGGEARFARQVIINAQGRARMAPDRDGDGIAEDANGRPLQCPVN